MIKAAEQSAVFFTIQNSILTFRTRRAITLSVNFIIFAMTIFKNQFKKLCSFFKKALSTAIKGKANEAMAFDNKARPLSKAYFNRSRKPVAPFAEIIWSNGTNTYVKHRPNANPQYNKVEGIKVAPNLIVLRCCRGAFYPDVCKIIAKKFGGRLPTLKEMLRITERIDSLNATLTLLGDSPLCRGIYLTSDTDEENGYTAIDIEKPEKKFSLKIYDECFFLAVR